MYVRCPNCWTSTRAAWAVNHGVTCVSCGRFTALDRVPELGATPQERFHRAYRFAREHRIDLASAYSVLLKILPIEEAFPIPDADRYDPGFREAVQGGFLSVQQAVERGDRVLYASTIALNHELEMKNAFLVADNKMDLPAAIEWERHGQHRAAMDPIKTGRLWSLVEVTAAVAMMALLLLAISPWTSAPSAGTRVSTPAPPAPVPPPVETAVPKKEPTAKLANTKFKVDEEGRVTQVSGPDPKSVLEGLCAHEQFAHDLAPVTLSPAVPPSPGSRLGIVRDMRSLGSARCVPIRRNAKTGQWVAGDGRHPIEVVAAPSSATGAGTLPL